MSSQHLGLINKWLRNIKDVYGLHATELDEIAGEEKALSAAHRAECPRAGAPPGGVALRSARVETRTTAP
jgi:hypothetical protein